LAQRQAEHRQEREREEQWRRDQVLAEFGGNPWGMADEILRLRHGLAQLADAIEWMKKGAPFAMIPPGPYCEPEEADVHDQH
jgi:hypothetical protein